MRVAACNNEPRDLIHLKALFEEYCAERTEYSLKMDTFPSVPRMLDVSADGFSFDIVILETFEAGFLSSGAARELHRLKGNADFIFITHHEINNSSALNECVTKYLVKPYKKDNFFLSMDKAMKNISLLRAKRITVKTTDGYTQFTTSEIVYTETGKHNYQVIHTVSSKSAVVRGTAGELFAMLSQDKSFIKCGASFNINLKYVRQVSREYAMFDNGDTVRIPYRSYPAVMERFLMFQMDT